MIAFKGALSSGSGIHLCLSIPDLRSALGLARRSVGLPFKPDVGVAIVSRYDGYIASSSRHL